MHASAVCTQTVSASAYANVRKRSTRKIPCGWEDRRKDEQRKAAQEFHGKRAL